MVFSSLSFLVLFLPIALGLYYVAPKRLRNGILFFVSLVFYAWGEPVYVVLMLFSTVVDFSLSLGMGKFDAKPKLRKLMLLLSIFVNLGMLAVFKYTGFAVTALNQTLGWSVSVPQIALPIGISFYTFQTMSYSIDVYRRKCPIQRNIISFGCYVAMFPQLIAGPIVRYITIAQELDQRQESWEKFYNGLSQFILGLCKKLVLANSVGQLWAQISAVEATSLPLVTAWLGIIAYGFQIFFDFSGYSDMAIGLGKMFGFSFPKNFDYPYISKSITEFWRRWHITLSTWFREYVYFPLGGNRVSKARNIFNLAVVWLCTGFWHGANWNFLAWGAYFGTILILEKYVFEKYLKKLPSFAGWAYMAFVVCIGWVLFAFDDFSLGLSYLGAMFGAGNGFVNQESLFLLLSYGLIMIVCAIASTPLMANIFKQFLQRYPKAKTALPITLTALGFVLALIYVVDAGYNPFLYFRF